jgi:hypothetical protein
MHGCETVHILSNRLDGLLARGSREGDPLQWPTGRRRLTLSQERRAQGIGYTRLAAQWPVEQTFTATAMHRQPPLGA